MSDRLTELVQELTDGINTIAFNHDEVEDGAATWTYELSDDLDAHSAAGGISIVIVPVPQTDATRETLNGATLGTWRELQDVEIVLRRKLPAYSNADADKAAIGGFLEVAEILTGYLRNHVVQGTSLSWHPLGMTLMPLFSPELLRAERLLFGVITVQYQADGVSLS